MSILRKAEVESPLRQGDVLDDIVTASLNEAGALASSAPGMVLVVSRNCKALRAASVIVARIRKFPLSELRHHADSTEKLIRFFETMRDGDGQPDTFYIGEIDHSSADRYCVKFDQLHTINIPTDDEKRRAFLQKHRRFSLNGEFVHDLHQRLFRAFASLGFDDVQWYSDADLTLIVDAGGAERLKLQAEVAELKNKISISAVSAPMSKETEGHRKALAGAESKSKQLEELLGPLDAEVARRVAHVSSAAVGEFSRKLASTEDGDA
jgi:hypothetical protein